MNHFRLLIFTLGLCLFSACGGSHQRALNFTPEPNFKQALVAAAADGKPILVVFDRNTSTVDAMAVLCLPEVAAVLREQYHVVWAAIDNPEPLPPDTNVLTEDGHKIKNLGGCYFDLMHRHFPETFSPMYALFGPNGKPFQVRGRLLYSRYVDPGDQTAVQDFQKLLALAIPKGQ